ncbi:MAG: signal peptidase I [Bacillota bacterium]|nr:MAG: signal peptidase I [Bacillota bacterium]
MNDYGERINEYKDNNRSNIRFLIICLFVFAWLAAFIGANRYFFYYIEVSGPSMMDTLQNEDVLCVARRKTPERGSVVIIAGEKGDETHLIKRVIGKEGDIIVIENGEVYLNGEKLKEEYIRGKTYVNKLPARKEYVVGKSEIFYLGDNRENSSDSRVYGCCTEEQIVGVVPEWAMSGFMKSLSKARANVSEWFVSLFT